jgi:hypothetical protein
MIPGNGAQIQTLIYSHVRAADVLALLCKTRRSFFVCFFFSLYEMDNWNERIGPHNATLRQIVSSA